MGLGLARDAQVLQVGAGLALGHAAPAARLEELAGERLDRGGTELADDALELLQALEVAAFDGLGPTGQVASRVRSIGSDERQGQVR